MKAFRKWEKIAVDKHQKEKAERDEVDFQDLRKDKVKVTFQFQADRVRREKLRRKREEDEQTTTTTTTTNIDSSASRIVEVTDEEAEKITRENEKAKV